MQVSGRELGRGGLRPQLGEPDVDVCRLASSRRANRRRADSRIAADRGEPTPVELHGPKPSGCQKPLASLLAELDAVHLSSAPTKRRTTRS